jgi:hypothetical protein
MDKAAELEAAHGQCETLVAALREEVSGRKARNGASTH